MTKNKTRNGAKKAIDNITEKAVDSGAGKPSDNRAEPTINGQEKPEITMESLLMAARSSMVAWNTRGMAKLTLDDTVNDNIPRDKAGNIDCSKIKFDPGYMLPPLDIEKRLEQLRGLLDPNNPWYMPKYQHINIRAIIKLYKARLFDGSYEIYVKNGKLVSREESYTGPDAGLSEGGFHRSGHHLSSQMIF